MYEERLDSGKSIALGTALIIATTLATGVVVAKWNGKESKRTDTAVSGTSVRPVAAMPPASDIEACNEYAKAVAEATLGGAEGAGKGAVSSSIGATAGTLYGLNNSNRREASAVRAYRACMRERGHTE
jgi:hypothetical protein